MYGRRVHEAVISAREEFTGVTIHLVNDEYDAGPILKQIKIPIEDRETAEQLEAKLKIIEKKTLLAFLNEWKINT
ncbi:MAG: hypothetical protein A2Z20_04255 [Bdellovibrionales bacterium RBG_16_40_8]|nr:MAG: hypothetical protein A2Z20_04255 [Bdellovibrionales bacterium RBG_16_40_8]